MYPHRIRLRGPWGFSQAANATNSSERVTVPCRWEQLGIAGAQGPVRFTRKFGYPGKADPEREHIWLLCSGTEAISEVCLNGEQLPVPEKNPIAVDVTALLGPRNCLELVVDRPTHDSEVLGGVALEIRRDAYLDDLALETGSTNLVVSGKVFGVAPQPLELYTLVNNQHADYRTIMPLPGGASFRIEIPGPSKPLEAVRVELVHVSEIWYAAEISGPEVSGAT